MKLNHNMKAAAERIIYKRLSERAMEVYSGCDPLDIYLTDDDTYAVRGVIEADSLSLADLEALLIELGEEDAE